MSDQHTSMPPAGAFVPFVGIVTPGGMIALRRYDTITGFDTREALGPDDGCVVHVRGEKPIHSKISPMNLAAQIRACVSGVSGSFGSGGLSPVEATHTFVTTFWATMVVTAPIAPAYTFHISFSVAAMTVPS